jgi:hypothetical protein
MKCASSSSSDVGATSVLGCDNMRSDSNNLSLSRLFALPIYATARPALQRHYEAPWEGVTREAPRMRCTRRGEWMDVSR